MVSSPFFIGAGDERDRATRIGAGRIGVGSTLMAAGLARRLFGIPKSHDTGALRLTARLFGVRNIVLGAWAIAARDQKPEQRRLCYQLNAAVDAADIALLTLAGLRHRELRQAAVMGNLLGVSALLAWMELLQDLD